MKYKSSMDRINAAVRANKGEPGFYAVSLEGKLLFGFVGEDSKPSDAEKDLREKGYAGKNFSYIKVPNPAKRYILSAA
mgnify:CR=1 FL=1